MTGISNSSAFFRMSFNPYASTASIIHALIDSSSFFSICSICFSALSDKITSTSYSNSSRPLTKSSCSVKASSCVPSKNTATFFRLIFSSSPVCSPAFSTPSPDVSAASFPHPANASTAAAQNSHPMAFLFIFKILSHLSTYMLLQ